MISSQMNNPFMIGDLVHIPKGVVLYSTENAKPPSPQKVNDKPVVALIINKYVTDFYNVSIGQEEYVVKKEDMALVTGKGMR